VLAIAASLLAAACGNGTAGARSTRPYGLADPLTDPGDRPTTAVQSAAETSPAPTRATRPASSDPTASGALVGRVIVLDPGHNGNNARHLNEISKPVDAGGFEKPCNTGGTATADGYSEATFNWDVAKLLAEKLRASGATVILTRRSNTGWGPCVDERGAIAARNQADLLLSIHADGSSATYHGFYVMSPAPLPGYTGRTAAPSRRAAIALRDAMVNAGFRPADYVASHGLWVRSDLGTLNRAGTPAITIECGNMLNSRDAATMTSRAGQSAIAAALSDGIARFLRRSG
jgi:N-acetylmuramoyl-L-alanine amidase